MHHSDVPLSRIFRLNVPDFWQNLSVWVSLLEMLVSLWILLH